MTATHYNHVDASWFRDLVQLSVQLSRRLDELDEHIRAALNDAYAQGVRDATKRRTGVDMLVPNDNEEVNDRG